MQQDALLNAKDEENDLTSRDSEIDDIQEKRNALEAYVYDIRKKFNERYCNFSSDSDKRSILKMLEETESSLYEDSDDKSKNVYCDKLQELKALLRPFENRYTISERNAQTARDFRHQIENISNYLKSWSADKTNEIQNMYNEADQWLLALQQLLDLLPKNIEQVLFVDDITEKMYPLFESFEHIKRGETSDCRRRETRSSHPGPLSTAMSFVLSLPMKPNETLKAHMKEIRAKFMEWFGIDFEKNEISTQTELTMQVLNRENRNDAEDLQSIIELFRLAGEEYLDEEANAAAVRDLLYCIFQYKVKVISSSDFIKEKVHKKCREIEECLKVRKIQNSALRFRDILDKMEELEAFYRTTVQNDATQNHQIDLQNPQSTFNRTTVQNYLNKRPSIRNMNMVGFDIGNDTSVVAVVKSLKTQAVHVLLNNDSKSETPSVVSFAQNKRQIGSQAAVSLGLRNPIATISQIKRIIGKRYKWPGVVDELSHLPFPTSEGPDGGILIHINHAGQYRDFTPVQILAMLLSNLRKMVETNSGGISTSSYVIGIPSYFTDSQRIAYLDAAEIAGMDRSRLQLMHEGTATALGYGFYKNDLKNGSTIVVFVDVGHCATQVTVVEFKVGGLRVLSHASDRNVGGRDFDRVLFDHFRKKFHEEHKINIVDPKNWRSCARLMAACQKAKKDLTSNSQASISIDCLVGDLDASGFVTRKDFEEMSRDLLLSIVETCEKALTLEGIDVRSVSSVELTGSGSRIPAVSEHVSKYFSKKLSRTLNGSECVVRGCALQCVLTSRLTSKTYKVEDVLPFTVGYISQPCDQFMLLRGQQFPHSVECNFKLKDSLHLDIYQIDDGKSPNASNTRSFEIGPFQAHGNQYSPLVKVRISLSLDGIVSVYASLARTMQPNNASEWFMVTDISGCGMQQDALINAKNEENELASWDKEIDEIKEKINALEAFIHDTQEKVRHNFGETEEWLKDKTILQHKEPKDSNPVLRLRDIMNKMEQLQALCSNILEADEKQRNHEEDDLSIPGEMKIPIIEGKKDTDAPHKWIKEKIQQRGDF